MLVLAFSATASANPYRSRELLAQGLAASDATVALARFEEAIDEDVDALAAYEAAIPLWIEAGQLTRMRDRLERVTSRHPRFAAAWYALGYVYRQEGRAKVAVLAYRTYVSLRPSNPAVYFGLGMAYQASGELDHAERSFLRYVRMETDPARAEFVAQVEAQLLAIAARRLCARIGLCST